MYCVLLDVLGGVTIGVTVGATIGGVAVAQLLSCV